MIKGLLRWFNESKHLLPTLTTLIQSLAHAVEGENQILQGVL